MRNSSALAIAGLICGAAIGCGSEDAHEPLASLSIETASMAANRAPVIRELRIDPQHPSVTDPLRAVASAFDPEGDPIEIEYVWWVDGERRAVAGPDPGDLEASVGTSVEVVATASDGRLRSDPVRFEIEILNRPPRVTGLGISPPQRVHPGGSISVTPSGEDPDGDPVSFRFEWFVNDEPSSHSESEFPIIGLDQGDRVRVSVFAKDRHVEGPAMQSADVVVSGAHPEITSLPPEGTPGSVYRYEVAAFDPDGDEKLRFSLAEAPEGMTVDSRLGVIEWTPSYRQSGEHTVSVAVADSSGLETTQTFEVSVKRAHPASREE
jgi:hypothetical protein